MASLNISGGQISVVENTVPIYINVLGEQLYMNIPESQILLYNMIIVNIELFGKPYWEALTKKNIFTLDYSFKEAVDKNIVSWSRDKKLESIL